MCITIFQTQPKKLPSEQENFNYLQESVMSWPLGGISYASSGIWIETCD